MLNKKSKLQFVNSDGEVIQKFPISNFEAITATTETLAEWIFQDRCEQSEGWYEQCGYTVEEVKEWLESEAD